MTHISKPRLVARRDLLLCGLAFSALPVLTMGQGAWAEDALATGKTLPSPPGINFAPLAPREQLLFDFDWAFTFGHGSDPSKDLGFGFGEADFAKTGRFEFAKVGYDDKAWRRLDLPHDWAVELPFVHDDAGQGDDQLRSHGYKPLGRRYPETSVGWYRREFDIPASDQGRRICVEFDGAFRDILVFVNGCFVGRSDNGYVPFRFDLTDFLIYGGKNAITIRADATYGDGWFYEGAGIYRHVWLLKTAAAYLDRWESVVRATPVDGGARLDLSTVVANRATEAQSLGLRWTVTDPTGEIVATLSSQERRVEPDTMQAYSTQSTLDTALLWSPSRPSLYSVKIEVTAGGTVLDGEQVTFGIRSATFDADKGFLLNGQKLKIQGVCNHQDHAGVGAALPDRLQAFRVEVMQGMGCNAIRTSHNMPTPELIDACDQMGIMIMCETRQMSSSPEGLGQLATMIKRYRNSPSVIIWSIGNEEYLLQTPMAEQGEKIAATMVRLCHELDPTRFVTAAVNQDNEKGVSIPLDLVGFNYNQTKYPDTFHAKYPKRPLIGSETSSAISTRGEYVTDPQRNIVSSYDGVVNWGETPETWWKFQAAREWEAGGFAWTGFDYRGEPTPYGWPSISSQFGIVDTCGFPKDYYYYYKAWWGREPSLHLFPHWNWQGKEGTEMPVWVYSNLDEVELIVNGRSAGRKSVPPLGHLEWKVVFTPGFIEAHAYKDGRRVLTERRETTTAPYGIRLRADRRLIRADGEDISVLTADVIDRQGRPVPTANDRLLFQIDGPGQIIGVGNGNPNCLESDKAPSRSLFNGLAQIIVQSRKSAGDIIVGAKAASPGSLRAANLTVISIKSPVRPSVA